MMNGFHLSALQLLLSGLAGASSQTEDVVHTLIYWFLRHCHLECYQYLRE